MSSIITRGMAQGNTAIFLTAHDTAPTTSKKLGRKPNNNAEVLTHFSAFIRPDHYSMTRVI